MEMKRYATGWEKIFANHISNRRLVPRTYKELLQSDNKKTNQWKNRQNILIDISANNHTNG